MHRILFQAIAAAVTAACTVAQAADDIRYVSTSGKNTNPCTLAKPCRSLQRAIRVTPAGGDIHILDSGFYGNNATIKKSLTISGNGHTVFLGNPVIVDNAEAVVALRGLTLDGRRTTREGIRIKNAAAVHIERCVVQAFLDNGITAATTIGSSNAGTKVLIISSTSRDNGGHGAQISGAFPRLTVDLSHFDGNGAAGMQLESGRAVISRSTASGNVFRGIEAFTSVSIVATVAAQNADAGFLAAQSSSMTVDSSVAHGNGDAGLLVAFGGTARISNSTFTSNAVGIRNSNSTLETRGNNIVRGNTTNVIGTRTPIDGV